MNDIEQLARIAINCGFHIHKELGPGLLESVYEILLAERLSRSGCVVERLAPVHGKQLLTYVRLAHQPVGLLMNFGGATFREGLQRIVNGPADRIAFPTDRRE